MVLAIYHVIISLMKSSDDVTAAPHIIAAAIPLLLGPNVSSVSAITWCLLFITQRSVLSQESKCQILTEIENWYVEVDWKTNQHV